MTCTDEGIVISAVKYSENGTIVKFYCAQEGIISAMVRSSSGKRGISKAYLSPFFVLQLVYTRGKHAELAQLKEVSGGSENMHVSDTIHKQALCLFAGELLKNILEPGYSNITLYDFLKEKHSELCALDKPGASWAVTFVLGIIQNLGFGIQPSEGGNELFNTQEGTFSKAHALSHPYTLDEALSQALSRLLMDGVAGDKSLNARLLNALMDFLSLHIQGFKRPKSLAVLREVFL
jgi:DNA repair protein RecO (recombination protein O)